MGSRKSEVLDLIKFMLTPEWYGRRVLSRQIDQSFVNSLVLDIQLNRQVNDLLDQMRAHQKKCFPESSDWKSAQQVIKFLNERVRMQRPDRVASYVDDYNLRNRMEKDARLASARPLIRSWRRIEDHFRGRTCTLLEIHDAFLS